MVPPLAPTRAINRIPKESYWRVGSISGPAAENDDVVAVRVDRRVELEQVDGDNLDFRVAPHGVRDAD